MNELRLGIDVGGTFTDLAAFNRVGSFATEKVLTTPKDPSRGALNGLRRLKKRGLRLEDVRDVVHGTTLVTNALIERTGARAALVTTRGFRDILYFGNEYRYDVYDPDISFPVPLVPRQLRHEIHERMDGRGVVVAPVDEGQARSVARHLSELEAEAIAVCFLHSYANPEHELIVKRILEDELPGVPVTLSHEVLPQIREYTRMSATVINAYVQPLVAEYLERLQEGLRREGVDAPLYLMTSSGGSITVETAAAFPIQLVESGPAAGALMAALLSNQAAVDKTLSFDMGGTTAKACVIRNGRPSVTQGFEVDRVRRFKRGSGLPVGVPVIDLLEIGAGGGSIAEIDEFGLLKVGPRSAGSVPGPACYGRGGVEPTVTDANLVLGLLDQDYFLGGEMALDVAAAQKAISRVIAEPLDVTVVEAAAAIHRLVTENMTEAARVHAIEMNVDLRGCTLIAFGGAGPLHAFGIAERLSVRAVLCPPEAGVLSALGLLAAPLAFEFARTLAADLDALDASTVNNVLAELEDEGRGLLERAGVAEVEFERTVDMCYAGQGYEVTTMIPQERFRPGELRSLGDAFGDTYEATYGRRLDGFPARCITWRVRASGQRPAIQLEVSFAAGIETDAFVGTREVHFPELGMVESKVWRRPALEAGAELSGPALVEDYASTVVIPPGVHAIVDRHSNIVLTGEALVGGPATANGSLLSPRS